MKRKVFSNPSSVSGHCLCGAVCFEIDYPAFWAWHDHAGEPARARRRLRDLCRHLAQALWVTAGEAEIARYEDKMAGSARSFCRALRHAADLRACALKPHGQYPARAVSNRTGRQPIYHIGIDEAQDWAYGGERLVPLKGYPGVVWTRPGKKQRTSRSTSS